MDIKPIRVGNEEEFERLRDRIDREVSHARHHWTLLSQLEEISAEYWREMNESNTFWHLTFIAHRDAVLAHLGRIYDEYTGSLNLARFLETVRVNRTFFSDDAFKERLKGNPHIESLVKNRPIDDAALDAELKTVSESDLVKELHSLRNKAIAHTDADVVRRDAPEAHKRWLPPDEIEKLLSTASDITTKYSLYFGGACYGGIAGADDFKATLRWVQKALAAHDAEIEAQHQRARELGLL
jgi:ribonuclease D